ncbi:MAG: phospholipid/cholesterol/gamma-HCH transport system permease protein [Cryptosporangiaceae bacterium]|nr:phospholipid/cholesterol/gamma-HCH transport system permease protein [Cryptosporangiaceae bacterium]
MVFGEQAVFGVRVVRSVPRAIGRYRSEVRRLIGWISVGRAAFAVAGVTACGSAVLVLLTGTDAGQHGYAPLRGFSPSAFTALLAAYLNTRELAPLAAGIALSLTAGSAFTAQLGAARASGEVDAIEAMGVPPLPYLVTTRVLAGIAATLPLYAAGLLASYVAARAAAVGYLGQAGGDYDHYLRLFLPPRDVLLSLVKAVVFSVIVVLTHCYHGFHARGDAGTAVARAVRASFVGIAVAGFFLSLAFWGAGTTIRIAG